jgi:hypothetical protein
MEEVRADGIRAHVRYLSDDLLEGRETGSAGALLAARYLASQLEQLHLKPVGDNGTYYQLAPFVKTRMDPARSRLVLRGAGSEAVLEYGKEFLINGGPQSAAALEAPLVFAGYGITAPEFAYDDYKDLDVTGKVAVVLTGEPPSHDPAFFAGEKDTEHAAGGSKIQLARSKGAVAVITVLVGSRAATYPWDRVKAGQADYQISLPDKRLDAFPALLVREEGAKELFKGAPSSWDDVARRAAEGGVKGFPLARGCRMELARETVALPAPNVVGLLEGSDPVLKRQAMVYSAHYDHIGRRGGTGDTIYNGAWDNASGTAGILEVARAFSALRPAPRRSILFLLVTGEEEGLLGSRYYTEHPVIPIEDTAADINLDMTDIFGIPKELVPLGAERSTLRETAAQVAREMGMAVGPDPTPELKTFGRSDQFSFARAGVPCLFLRWANEYEDVPASVAKAAAREKLDTIYHKVGDEFDPKWSWEGMRRHAQVAFLLGLHVANETEMPHWNEKDPLNKPRHVPTPGNAD